jgi:hypothetical protein
MANSLEDNPDGYTDQQAEAIRKALSNANLKPDADWPSILSQIIMKMDNLCRGHAHPDSRMYASKVQRRLNALTTNLEAAIKSYEQLGERLQWHLDDEYERPEPQRSQEHQREMSPMEALWSFDRVVLDCVREVRPPFSPDYVVEQFSTLIKSYRVAMVVGDRYGGEWCREPFRKHGLMYQVAEKTRSELYRDLLPLLNSRTVALLDQPRLLAQLCALERHTARAGKDSINHGLRGHDDLINSAAGAIHLVKGGARTPGIILLEPPRFDDEDCFVRIG